MNDLGPKRTEEISAPRAPDADFRSDPDAPLGVDRQTFVEGVVDPAPEAGVEREISRSELEKMLETMRLPQGLENDRLQQDHILHSEMERKRQVDLTLAGDLFERVQLVMHQVDTSVMSSPGMSMATHLSAAIREVVQNLATIVKGSRNPDQAEAERIIEATGLLRKLLNDLLEEIAKSKGLSSRQQSIFGALGELLDEMERPEAHRPPEAMMEQGRGARHPVAVRIYERILELLTAFVFGPEASEEETRAVPVIQASSGIIDAKSEQQSEKDDLVVEAETESAFVHIIHGFVRTADGKGIGGVRILGGVLGTCETSLNGEFIFRNIPHGHRYTIGPFKEGLTFAPPLLTGILGDSLELEFTGSHENS